MIKYVTLTSFLLVTTSAFAAGTHSSGHDEMVVGMAGQQSKVTRTINVTMSETDDGKMVFSPASIDVRKGQTVKFSLKNIGEVDHEFVLDEEAKITEHKALMEKFPDMEHDDPNARRLAPGEASEIIWTFTNDGVFQFACLVPGHYDAGMHGKLKVAKN